MKNPTVLCCLAASSYLALAVPLFAAATVQTGKDSMPAAAADVATDVSVPKVAEACLANLRTFDTQMHKDGHWLGGSGYGYGYPMGGLGYGYPMGGVPAGTLTGYQNARPGYEIRMLSASANILAKHGQQQQCEDVLATTRIIYKQYLADLNSGKVPAMDVPAWRAQQIAAAQPVVDESRSWRSDQLIGIDVRTPQNQALGSVDDIVMSPKTGAIAYLVIARGGLFGFGEEHVPVAWENFKVAPNGNLLVLDATKAAMDGAPKVSNNKFAAAGTYDQEAKKVDAYWTTHLSSKSVN